MDLAPIDAILNRDQWKPRWGWHDDHRKNDRTPKYLPALQQVRYEFQLLGNAIEAAGLVGGRALQLGLGECDASHHVWAHLFPATTITFDFRACLRDWPGGPDTLPGGDIRSDAVLQLATSHAPYDFLWIDAGHLYADVESDFDRYGPLVRPGGMIGFHDAYKRPGYEAEIEVWRFVDALPGIQRVVGRDQIGTAWLVVKP